jgi:YD repeat-containing protein
MTGPTGIVTHNDYDGSENLLDTIVDPGTGSHLHLTTAFGTDAQGDVTSTTDPRGFVTTSLFDPDRRKMKDDHHDGNATAALNAATQTVYDPIGRVTDSKAGTAFSGTTVTTWLTTKHTTYTPTSKVATVTDADSRTTTTTYDDGDRTSNVSDPLSRNVHLVYCASGSANCAANAVKTEYRAWVSGLPCSSGTSDQQCYRRVTYFPNGEQRTIEDANGNTTHYAYDPFVRLRKTTFPDSTTEQIPTSGGYDANGNVLQRINRNGQTLTYQYNALDWMTQKVSPSPAVTTSWTGFCGAASEV